MVKRIALTIAALLVITIAIILLYATTRPDSFRVQRTASIKAPPEKIYVLVNDLPAHRTWSPWEQKDPGMKRTYSGPSSGKGAIYEWEGNNEIGKGRMEIVESSPAKIIYDMHFLAPFEARNVAEITMAPKGDTTDVTWVIYGPMPYLNKVITIFCDIDGMIGKEFETGLANLKSITEK
jgi:hypothetical protein